jgi:hypothetical protein
MNLDLNDLLQFLVAVLATWRVAHLLTQEDGPSDIVVRLRAHLGNSWLGTAMDCFYCASIWVAIPMTIALQRPVGVSVMYWLALSGGACLLQRLTAPAHAQVSH